ncbi:LAFE_0B10528g1_1 [Lachancea fermentati]|uniref:dolichyl-phosphate-mannose--protein mannosyltransferase n=1 Tax=Lachancea fermentati TaxID=4955 RepID=A0A1G4M8W6_LACFM|nr:LAFE_0B10528g1_1 [Lachancea fermentati]
MKLARGPYRPYISQNVLSQLLTERISKVDYFFASMLFLSFLVRQYLKFDELLGPSDSESDILKALDHYKRNEFFLSTSPPLGIQFLYALSNVCGGVSIKLLRRVSVSTGSLTISLIYLSLRKSKVSRIISLAISFMFSHLPLFEDEARSASLNILEMMFLSLTLFAWFSFEQAQSFTKGWLSKLIILGLSIGFLISTKTIGFITWLWIIILCLKQMWDIIGDLRFSNKEILYHGFLRFIALILMPLMIFTSSYYHHISISCNHSQVFSSFMSPYFKANLLPESLPPPDIVYYGSSVLIRHQKSLAGYLHSHNYTYRGGSQEQQVTLYDYANDADNEWIIEPENEDKASVNGTLREPIPVKNKEFIKLRHRVSGKLLRSSNAKPPVSEQDYDKEVACTGDSEYKGNADELWRIKFIRGKTGYRESLSPVIIEFQLENKGQGCTLLSHDLRLPDWGFEQQEVLCVDPPTLERTLFYVERSNLYSKPGAFLRYPREWSVIRFAKLFVEYLLKQIKYDYYVKNYKQTGDVPVERWIWFTHTTNFENMLWLSPLLCSLFFVLVVLHDLTTWNPWSPSNEVISCNKYLYKENCMKSFLGWLLHYHIFTKSKHENLYLVQYLPSYLLSLFLAAHSLNFLWCHGRFSALISASILCFMLCVCMLRL